ncbi:MAG: hypothetical protein ACOY81_00175 [Bacillota bacterium]|uniref:hypothetical protein n=1 Tax=Desulfurispora thermophila TaxID=265470 RepID=UPI00036A5F6C|nr:hypothetical protein [Desulfurispora thermophila]
MTVKEALTEWLKYNKQLVYEMRGSKSSEYKMGFADGVEAAVEALEAYLADLPEYCDILKESGY